MAAESNQRGTQLELVGMLKRYAPHYNAVRKADILFNRYQLLMNQPLPKLGSPLAKAYVVRDTQDAAAPPLYGVVFEQEAPLRQSHMTLCKEFRHPGFVSLIEYGLAEISTVSQVRMVAILEQPRGIPLSEFLAPRKQPTPPSERILINSLLRPIMEVLVAFSTMSISHNCINLDTVYIHKNTLQLGECISAPAGFAQDSLFEPVEIAQMSAWAKPDTVLYDDCYAFAIMALHVALGFMPYAGVSREELLKDILARGTYHALVISWDFSEVMQDLFRGLLNDTRRERWDAKSIENWFVGRRFNLILPSTAREVARSFDLLGASYFNRKSLAYALFRGQEESLVVLFDTHLSRWVATSLHNPELGDLIERIRHSNGGDNARAVPANMDLLARIMVLLDPQGPIRFHHLCLSLDGFGKLFLHAYFSNNPQDLEMLQRLLNTDLLPNLAEQQPKMGQELISTIQKERIFIRMRGLGFGVERCLYDLHPQLACQSPLVKRYHATTLKELLNALDTVAVDKNEHVDFLDRHVAAFIASKLDIKKEIHNIDIEKIPALAKDQRLIMLQLLQRAHNKIGAPPMQGLTFWIAACLAPLFDIIHRRSLQEECTKRLQDIAKRGSLLALMQLFFSREVFIRDHQEFRLASYIYNQQSIKIAQLKDNRYLVRSARVGGRGIAQIVAYSICLATVYFTLKSHFSF